MQNKGQSGAKSGDHTQRKAWMGEPLGFAYADPDKRLPVPGHGYRLGIVAGIQPERAGCLLDDTDGGTPQRFLWMPAADAGAPDEPPPVPARLEWQPPRRPQTLSISGRVELSVCATARQAIDGSRLARLRGNGDTLDGHARLARLKVAAALALLDRRVDVNDEDWTLSGTVMAVSDRTRAGVVNAMHRTTAAANRRRGEAEGDRAVTVAERVADRDVKRVAQSVTRLVGEKPAGITHAKLRRALAGRDRQHFDTAVERCIAAGLIVATTIAGQGQAGVTYHLPGGIT